MKQIKRLLVVYLIGIHALLALVLVKSDFITKVRQKFGQPVTLEEIKGHFHHRTVHLQERSVGSVPDNAVIFIGDSITQGLCVAAVEPLSVNFGIASDTTDGVLKRLHHYSDAIDRAACIVLAVGINDSAYRSRDEAIENYRQILSRMPFDRPVIVSSLLPVDSRAEKITIARAAWARGFNEKLESLAKAYSNSLFLDHTSALDTDSDGHLDENFHNGDGIHLSTAGNLAWAESLRAGISRVLAAK